MGPSGSGKSTLFRLLLGFDFPESGTIYYDGQDLAGLDVNAVRRQLGVVIQNSRMMSGSIFENIASGALVTMDEAWEAARASGLADDIEAMPMGMHTVVSEGGSNLSGGQRQRLLIARALVLKPRILLFDEATSALDNRTQAIVSQSLERLQVTRIAIATDSARSVTLTGFMYSRAVELCNTVVSRNWHINRGCFPSLWRGKCCDCIEKPCSAFW